MTRAANYQLIVGQLYKLGMDGILQKCVLDHERQEILHESHEGVVGEQCARKEMNKKVLRMGLWWPSLFHDVPHYCQACDVCQRIGNPSRRIEMPVSYDHLGNI